MKEKCVISSSITITTTLKMEENQISNDEIVVAITNHHEQLIDQGRIITKNSQKSRTTALNHFHKFLAYENSPYSSLNEMPAEALPDCILGRFSDYITKVVKSVKKFNTHDNYISQVHTAIIEKYQFKEAEYSKYFTKLRFNIEKDYRLNCSLTGESFVDNAACCSVSDRDIINFMLMRNNMHEERAFIALDWVGVGRVGEVMNFFNNEIIYVNYYHIYCY